MKKSSLTNRLFIDFMGLIGVVFIYFAFVITDNIYSLNDWENIISLIILAFTGGVLIGFISFKKDGIATAGITGFAFLVVLVIYGITGVGLGELTNNYVLLVVFRVAEGLVIFCLNVLGGFIGKIIVPTKIRNLKGEDTKLEKTAKIIEEETSERIFCSICGSEVSRTTRICNICGKREK